MPRTNYIPLWMSGYTVRTTIQLRLTARPAPWPHPLRKHLQQWRMAHGINLQFNRSPQVNNVAPRIRKSFQNVWREGGSPMGWQLTPYPRPLPSYGVVDCHRRYAAGSGSSGVACNSMPFQRRIQNGLYTCEAQFCTVY